MLILNSCEKEYPVQLEVKQSADTIEQGQQITFEINLAPNPEGGELGDFQIAVDFTSILDTNFNGSKSFSFTYSYLVPQTAIPNESLTFTFKAVEQISGVDNIVTKSLYVKEGIPAVKLLTDIQSQFSSETLDNTMMFVINYNEVLTTNGNSELADLAFVWTENEGYCIVSPNSQFLSNELLNLGYDISNKNETKINIYDGNWTDFDDETVNNLEISSNILDEGGIGFTNLEENNILIFETSDNQKGAILIKTKAKTSKYLITDFIIQKK